MNKWLDKNKDKVQNKAKGAKAGTSNGAPKQGVPSAPTAPKEVEDIFND